MQTKNLFYLISFIILTFVLNSLTLAQNNKLSGVVFDKETNAAIYGAVINIQETNNKTYSGKSGEYYLADIKAGEYVIKITSLGYKNLEYTAKINSGENKRLEFYLEPAGVEIGEITVTSTRYETLIKDVPMPFEVVGKDEIFKSTGISISDMVKNKPGISLVRDGIWATDISIRGLSRNNVVTLIDGNRIETANDIAARLSMFDLTGIERIEVIKGASSSLYGTGAMGGVVNIITKNEGYNSNFYTCGSLLSSFNSVNNGGTGRLMLNAGFSKWYARVSGMYRSANNTATPDGDLKNSQYRDEQVSADVGYKPHKNHEIKLNYQKYYGSDIGIPGAAPLFPSIADVKYTKVSRDFFTAEYNIKNIIPSLQNISFKYFLQNIQRDVETLPYTVQIKPASGNQRKQRISVLSIMPQASHNTMGGQIQSQWKLSEMQNLIAGVEIWQRNLESSRERNQKIEIYDSLGINIVSTTLKTTGETPLPKSDFRTIGLYAEDVMKVFSSLKVTLGGRYDFIKVTNDITYNPVYDITNGVRNNTPAGQKVIWQASSNNNESWSTNLGVLYSLLKDVDLTFNAARTFRSPSIEERYQYIDLGSSVRIGNPTLESEKGYFLDLGLRVWKQKYSFHTNIFLNNFSDLVVELPGTYDGKPALIKTNIGKARLYGFDMDFMYNFYKSFVAYISAGYVRGEDIENNLNLPQIPPFNGRVGLKSQIAKYFILDVSSTVFAEQDKVAAGEITTLGYAVFDASLSSVPFKLAVTNVKILAGVENMFDKSYRNHLSTSRGSITTEPGRNLFVRINVDF